MDGAISRTRNDCPSGFSSISSPLPSPPPGSFKVECPFSNQHLFVLQVPPIILWRLQRHSVVMMDDPWRVLGFSTISLLLKFSILASPTCPFGRHLCRADHTASLGWASAFCRPQRRHCDLPLCGTFLPDPWLLLLVYFCLSPPSLSSFFDSE